MKSDEAFRWIEARVGTYTAIGCHLHWKAHVEALTAGDETARLFAWWRDARDAAAWLGVSSDGKARRWDLAIDLIREGDAPDDLKIMLMIMHERAEEATLGRGRLPLQPMQEARDAGMLFMIAGSRMRGMQAQIAYARVARTAGRSEAHVRRLFEGVRRET